MLQAHHPRGNNHSIPPALLFQLQDDNPQTARVAAAQQLLFPATARVVCDEIGLNSWAALKLFEDGWLSFSPEGTSPLNEAQEAELRFLAGLVLAGCDRNMLTVLLTELPKPYAYDLKRLYFDWAVRRWRALPDPQAHPEAAFTDWLEMLVQDQDAKSLTGIGELARDALARVKSQDPQPEFSPPPGARAFVSEAKAAGPATIWRTGSGPNAASRHTRVQTKSRKQSLPFGIQYRPTPPRFRATA